MTPMRPAALPDLTGLTILVVEDNFDALNLIRAILDTAGAHPLLATHTGQARDFLRTRKAHLILCDLNLPGEDGTHFMQWLRSRTPAEGGEIPAIAITAPLRGLPGGGRPRVHRLSPQAASNGPPLSHDRRAVRPRRRRRRRDRAGRRRVLISRRSGSPAARRARSA